MPLLSIIVPCYNEGDALPIFLRALTRAVNQLPSDLDFEIWLIDDGSTDNTLPLMKAARDGDRRFEYVSFSRNFGKEAAMLAGFQRARGDYVALMDADMQDPPELLLEMYNTLSTSEDYDCVGSRRVTRKGEPPVRSWFARMFYKLINKLSRTEVQQGTRDFRMMKRPMVNALMRIGEQNRFSKGLFSWVGFRTKWLEYENVERVAGKTKWSFWRLFLYSLDGIISLSTVPLNIALVVGLALMVLFVPLLVLCLALETTPGWLPVACIASLVGGLQIFASGVLGLYLSKVHVEVMNRPIYIVKEETAQQP